jgi:hypothetical protein
MQVHRKEACEISECPYAKKTGRARPNCVWNEHKQRCRSPEPSFFYMLTNDRDLYLTDPDDQTLKCECLRNKEIQLSRACVGMNAKKQPTSVPHMSCSRSI